MLLLSIWALALNVGTWLFFYKFSELPFLNTPTFPILYALGLIQVVLQRVLGKEHDEIDRLRIVTRWILPLVGGLVPINLLSRFLFSVRYSFSDFLRSAISIIDLGVINISALILAISSALTLALLIAYMIKAIQSLRNSQSL